MSATTSMRGAFQAERIRWRSSAVTRLRWAAAGYGGLSAMLALSTDSALSWYSLLAYQNLWIVGFGPLFLALIVDTQASLEHSYRGGGTWSRPTAPWVARFARFGMLTPTVLMVNLLAMLVPIAAGLVLAGPPPVAHLLASVAVPTLAQLGLLAVLVRSGIHVGRTAVLAVGLAWAVAAVLTAESTAWPISPFAWTLRGSLPVIGTHANGEALLPSDALATASIVTPTLLSLALAISVLALPVPGGRVGAPTARHDGDFLC